MVCGRSAVAGLDGVGPGIVVCGPACGFLGFAGEGVGLSVTISVEPRNIRSFVTAGLAVEHAGSK